MSLIETMPRTRASGRPYLCQEADHVDVGGERIAVTTVSEDGAGRYAVIHVRDDDGLVEFEIGEGDEVEVPRIGGLALLAVKLATRRERGAVIFSVSSRRG